MENDTKYKRALGGLWETSDLLKSTWVADTLEEAPGEAVINENGQIMIRVAPDTFILPRPCRSASRECRKLCVLRKPTFTHRIAAFFGFWK